MDEKQKDNALQELSILIRLQTKSVTEKLVPTAGLAYQQRKERILHLLRGLGVEPSQWEDKD